MIGYKTEPTKPNGPIPNVARYEHDSLACLLILKVKSQVESFEIFSFFTFYYQTKSKQGPWHEAISFKCSRSLMLWRFHVKYYVKVGIIFYTCFRFLPHWVSYINLAYLTVHPCTCSSCNIHSFLELYLWQFLLVI